MQCKMRDANIQSRMQRRTHSGEPFDMLMPSLTRPVKARVTSTCLKVQVSRRPNVPQKGEHLCSIRNWICLQVKQTQHQKKMNECQINDSAQQQSQACQRMMVLSVRNVLSAMQNLALIILGYLFILPFFHQGLSLQPSICRSSAVLDRHTGRGMV